MDITHTVLPDEVLDLQLCDKCHKYLSVKPIMISRTTTLCGRCVNIGDQQFVESSYNILAERSLFKCINRFDGCRMLLNCNQIPNHETKCKSEEYKCIMCPLTSNRIPSYMFPYHVKKKHHNSYLKNNIFPVRLNDFGTRIYFYKKENHLFFLERTNRSFTHSVIIELNAFFIGESNSGDSKVFQKYYLEKSPYTTTKTECFHLKDIHRSVCCNTIQISSDNTNEFMMNFEFEIPNTAPVLSVQTFNSIPSVDSYGVDNCNEKNIKSILNDFLLRQMKACNSSLCKYGRVMDLTKGIDRADLAVRGISFNSASNKLILRTIEDSEQKNVYLCLHCIFCKTWNGFCNMFITKTGMTRYLLCIYCKALLRDILEMIPSKFIIFPMLQILRISSYPLDNFSYSSKVLEYHPNKRFCFIDGCSTSKGTLCEHLAFDHGLKVTFSEDIQERITFEIFRNKNISSKLVFGAIILNLELIKDEWWLSGTVSKNGSLFIGIFSLVDQLIARLINTKLKIDCDRTYGLRAVILNS